jgi:DNA-directed RNA polymerase specialized sigma24 family protein
MTASVAVSPQVEAGGRGDGAFGGRRLLGQLLVASGRHDEAAFARFYQLTSPWTYSLLCRRPGSIGDAEDALRRVYTTLWQRAADFKPSKQSALAWLTTLTYDVVGP